MVIVYKVVAEGFFILFLLIQCEGFLLVEQKNKNKKSLFQLTTSNWFFHKYGGSLVTFFTTLIKTRAILYSLNQTVDNGNNVCQSGNVIIIIDLVTIASQTICVLFCLHLSSVIYAINIVSHWPYSTIQYHLLISYVDKTILLFLLFCIYYNVTISNNYNT